MYIYFYIAITILNYLFSNIYHLLLLIPSFQNKQNISNVHYVGSRGDSICNSLRTVFCTSASLFQTELLRDGIETPLSKAVQVSIDCMSISNNMATVNQLVERLLSHLHWFDSVTTHLPSCLMVI